MRPEAASAPLVRGDGKGVRRMQDPAAKGCRVLSINTEDHSQEPPSFFRISSVFLLVSVLVWTSSPKAAKNSAPM